MASAGTETRRSRRRWRTMRRRWRRSRKAGIMVVTCPEAFLPSSAEKSKKRDERQSVEQRQRLLR